MNSIRSLRKERFSRSTGLIEIFDTQSKVFFTLVKEYFSQSVVSHIYNSKCDFEDFPEIQKL